MARERHGRANWPGVEGQESACSYTYRHGAAPVAATLVVPKYSNPTAEGDLVIYDGNGSLTLVDCRVDRFVVDHDSGNVHLAILDRRWAWSYGLINGSYNIRDDKEQIIASRRKSLRELAALCFEAMDEDEFELGQLPDDEFPPVNWQDANPAKALEALIGVHDFQICLSPFSDVPSLVKRGEGEELPDRLSIKNDSPSVAFPTAPELIVIAGDDIEVEMMFRLLPMGLDVDGLYKSIFLVAYTPPDLWASTAPPTFPNIPQLALLPDQTDLPSQNAWIHHLAEQTVFRAFQIDLGFDVNENYSAPDGILIPFLNVRVKTQEQITITPKRVFAVLKPDGYFIEKPAEVTGLFIRDHQSRKLGDVGPPDVDSLGNTFHNEKVNSGFSVSSGLNYDQYNNIVTFNKYIYRRLPGGKIAPPILRLLCAVTVRDATTFAPARYYYGLPDPDDFMPAKLPGAVVIKKADLRLKAIAKYELQNKAAPTDPPIWKITEVTSNRDEVDEKAAAYADAADNYFSPFPADTREYPGIVQIEPDGATQEITWSISISAAPLTVASRNCTQNLALPTPEIVKMREVVKPAVLGEDERLRERVRIRLGEIRELGPDRFA